VDDNEFKARVERLERISKTLEKLPAEVRSDAFELLKGYVTEHASEPQSNETSVKDSREVAGSSDEEFFATFNHDKPADNAKLIAAWFYREYGVAPFSLDEVSAKANDVGVTVPTRLDMTFNSAKEKGKKLFTQAGMRKFMPTVSGEAHLKATYSVKKGTKKRTGDAG
jgi:hypothetical protein